MTTLRSGATTHTGLPDRARPGREGWPGPDRPCNCWTALGHGTRRWEGAYDRVRWLNERWIGGSRELRTFLGPSAERSADADDRQPQGPRCVVGNGGCDRAHRLDPGVRRAERRAPVGLALVGPQRHRALGLGG